MGRPASASLTPATGARTTRLRRTQLSPSSPRGFAGRAPGCANKPERPVAPKASAKAEIKTSFVRTLLIAHGPKPALQPRRVQNAAASIASHPASVTIAIRPSVGWDKIGYEVICVRRKQKYFCKEGWTGKSAPICLSGKSSRAVRRTENRRRPTHNCHRPT